MMVKSYGSGWRQFALWPQLCDISLCELLPNSLVFEIDSQYYLKELLGGSFELIHV